MVWLNSTVIRITFGKKKKKITHYESNKCTLKKKVPGQYIMFYIVRSTQARATLKDLVSRK